ncbi:MAG: Uma2 family endonuclease [Gemmataceae bacterium]
MSSTLTSRKLETLADLLDDLGVGPERVRLQPALGTATEKDVLEVHAREKRLCELVDGVLVEKGMGYRGSCLAGVIFALLDQYVNSRNLGLVSCESGMMRLMPGLVRIPDVAYASWERVPGGHMPTEPIPDLVPDLAVEVLSESNREKEMNRKCTEYFDAGVNLVWLIDPKTRTAEVYAGPDQWTALNEDQSLDGGKVLPGFQLPLATLFAVLDRQARPT